MTKKYSDVLKLKVVEEYQGGFLGIRPLAKKYGISKSVVARWIRINEKLGTEGLRSKKHNKSYSVQFKLDVLSYMKRTGSSEMDTALHFGLTDSSTIARWKKAFLEGKVEGLNKHKGSPPMSKKKKTEQKTAYEQELERENELLRLEVEYLKKLRAFRMNPEGYLEKHKQRYHSNSKKSSN